MDLQDISKRLHDFNAGKLTPAEKEALWHTLAALTEEERMALFPVDAYVQQGDFPMSEEEVTIALARFRATVTPAIGKTIFIQWKKVSRYAAIFILIAGSVFFLRKGVESVNRNKTLLQTAKDYRRIKVADGHHGLLVLTDGTRITINGGSELLYPETFNGKERMVYLKEGEAYFDIAQDAQHPFIVKTTQLKVQVLGTSFSLRDYSDESQAFVSVNSGRIALEHAGGTTPSHELTAGTGSVLDKQTKTFMQQEIDSVSTTAWIRRELIFQDASLQQVLQVLQHQYAVHFEVKDSLLLKRRFTATFPNNGLQVILQQLKLMGHIRYTITNDQIVIQ
jgi:ferric-dicitrate binding protein FerR (iron transport regulator)